MATQTVPADRQQVALDASCRLEGLLRMLRREANTEDPSFDLVLDDTLRRAGDLAGVIALALLVGDETPTDDLRRTVYGELAEKEVAHG